jgi:hypothetical protein
MAARIVRAIHRPAAIAMRSPDLPRRERRSPSSLCSTALAFADCAGR